MAMCIKQFLKTIQVRDSFWISAVFSIALIIMLPVYFFGIPSGSDLPQHYQFAQTYYQSILSGNYFPVWSGYENHGFGGIGIRFYPPLANYALAVARILTGNWYDASCLVLLFWMFAGSLGIYIWAREWLSPMQSAAAASLFAIAPHHLAQIYQYFLYAEFAALAFLPFCFAFVTKVCRRGKPFDIFCLAIFYALLILTHIPTIITGSISLAIYAAFIIDRRKFAETIFKLLISVAVGLSATVFHWLKIATEINWLNHLSSQFTSGDYDFRLSFFPIFISAADRYFAKGAYLKDLISVAAVIFLILPVVSFLLLKLKTTDGNKSEDKVLSGLIFTGLFAFFMSTLLSAFIWETFSPLQKIQFPFRWLSVVSTVGAIAFVIAAKHLIRFGEKAKRAAVYSVLLILLGITLFNVTQIILPSAPYTRNDFEKKLSNLLNEESFECWWTIWSQKQAFNNPEKVSAESRPVTINAWNSEFREFEIEAGDPVNARIATFYYPYWKAEINGHPSELQMFDDGTISIPLSGETARVRLFFQEPLYIRWAFYVSGFIWLMVLSLLSAGLIHPVFRGLKSRFYKL